MSIKVAIVGSGISGLAAAHALRGKAHLTLLEAGDYFGGHTHTVDVTLPTSRGLVTHGVDTGFLVLNERTYPQLIAMLAELGVATAKSEMSFSVQASDPGTGRCVEWSGSNLNTVFAQRTNLSNPRFWGMLRDVLRFNALATRIAVSGTDAQLTQPLGEFLQEQGFGAAFCDWYFLPMMACIWSCPTAQMLQFPVSTMVRFCHNHGLLQITHRPQWWTVQGGARHYVEKITAAIADKRLNTPVRRIEHTVATPDGASVVETPVIMLDEFLEGAPVDFIKMDIQGWELPALKGMEKTLAANPNIQLYVELWPYGMAAAGATPKGLFEFLNDFGFSIEFRPKRGMPTAAQFARYSRIKYWFTDLYVRR